jgi:hypothetical protein
MRQDESYDHYLRDSRQLNRTVAYIEENPVSAGLETEAGLPYASTMRASVRQVSVSRSFRHAEPFG